MPDNAGDYGIGSKHFAGTSKLLEEMGELQQVLGKIMGCNGLDHWDGDLLGSLLDELADVTAAVTFFVDANRLPTGYIAARTASKVVQFQRWHEETQ